MVMLNIDDIKASNSEFVKLADERIDDGDFDIYMQVKEKMLMQDILLNIPRVQYMLGIGKDDTKEEIAKAVNSIRLTDVYYTYKQLLDADDNVGSLVELAFRLELLKQEEFKKLLIANAYQTGDN